MPSPALRHFGNELKLVRQHLSMSQQDVADAIPYSKSYVAMIESGARSPSIDFARRIDEKLETGGRFERIHRDLLIPESSPLWFRPWVEFEREAQSIRWFEPLLVPGLVQTEEYARAILNRDDLVTARLDRQRVLDTARVWTIISEDVLRHQVGDPKCMVAQLQRLLTVEVQILPDNAQTTIGFEGTFALATVDGTEMVYVDTPPRGFVLTDEEVILDARRRWEAIAAEALPREQSRVKIEEMMETWTS